MSCGSKCCVALPHGAMCWFAVQCVTVMVFPDHTHLLFGYYSKRRNIMTLHSRSVFILVTKLTHVNIYSLLTLASLCVCMNKH